MKRLLLVAILPLSLLMNTHTMAEGDWPEPELKTELAKVDMPAVSTPAATSTLSSAPSSTAPSSQAQATTMAYLGIGVDILPQSVVAQMPSGVSTGEGILVTRFADDSPAKKSGLRAYDILLSYDETKLIHPKQFIELIRDDKPGREVKLKVLRNGSVNTQVITLGSQDIPQAPNGLAIKQLGKNLYLASIRFTDASGKKQLREYKGTREQIYYQAMNAKDLPEKDRQQIMYAAGGPQKKSNNSWGSFMPFGNSQNNKDNNSWGSFMPFGGNNNGNNSWGSFSPFNR
ncbi:MAG: PDZ domain-containing protein [Thiotrichaceae bacterium]